MKSWILTGLWFGSLFSFALGQGATPPPVQQKTHISFLLVGGAIPVTGAYFESAKKAPVPVELRASGKSALYLYDGGAEFTLFASAKAQPILPRSIVSVSLPPVSKQLLVLLAKGPKSTDAAPAYLGIAVEDDWSVFPAGSVRVLNYSNKRLAVKIGAVQVELGVGPAKAVGIADGKSNTKEVALQIASLDGSAYALAYANKLKASVNHRYTVVVLPPAAVNAAGVQVVLTREAAPFVPPPGVKSLTPNR